MPDDRPEEHKEDRRKLLKRVATAAWATPVIMSVTANRAAAQESAGLVAYQDQPNLFTARQTIGDGGDVFLQLATGEEKTFQVVSSSDHADFTWLAQESAVFSDVRNPALYIGYNVGSTGTQADGNYAMLCTAIEADYVEDGRHTQEWYVQHVTKDGTKASRPLMFTIKEDGAPPQFIRGHISADHFVFMNDNLVSPIEIMVVNADYGLQMSSTMRIRKSNNNQPFLQQRNKADTGYVDMMRVGASDEVAIATEGGPTVAYGSVRSRKLLVTEGRLLLQGGNSSFTSTAAVLWATATERWQMALYSADPALYLYDTMNARFHATYTAGASPAAALTRFHSRVEVDGPLSLGGDVALPSTGGTRIGTAPTQKIGFFNATPVVQPPALTQQYSTADRTLGAYASNPESSPYTPANKADARLSDLNSLRVAYENLRVFTEDLAQFVNALVDDLQSLGLVK